MGKKTDEMSEKIQKIDEISQENDEKPMKINIKLEKIFQKSSKTGQNSR